MQAKIQCSLKVLLWVSLQHKNDMFPINLCFMNVTFKPAIYISSWNLSFSDLLAVHHSIHKHFIFCCDTTEMSSATLFTHTKKKSGSCALHKSTPNNIRTLQLSSSYYTGHSNHWSYRCRNSVWLNAKLSC